MAATRYNSLGENHANDSDSMELMEERQKKGNNDKSESRTFNPNEQTWRLFKEQGVRLAMTMVFIALMIAALRIFESRGNVSHLGKRLFNFVVTGLSLLLGLSFFDAFKDMAKVLRWRILANQDFSLREADLILSGGSLMKLATLMRESWKRPRILCICAVWIALNIAAQAAIGMIGLTYSMENGIDSSGTITKNGMINATRLDCFYVNDQCKKSEIVQQGLAHAYGETITGRHGCRYTKESEIQSSAQNCSYFQHTDGREFAIRYAEYNPEDRGHAYPFFTDRIVKASAGECSQYDIDHVSEISSGDGTDDTWLWTIVKNSTVKETLSIPKRDAAYEGTTYIYNGTNAPPGAPLQACGPRCISLYAWRSGGNTTHRGQAVFKCPITVSEMTNVDEDWQNLPDNIARYAAASIALTGRNAPDWRQYRLYTYESPWEVGNSNAAEVGALMSEFAIGSLVTMANLNPQISANGTLPILGYNLTVEWRYVIALAVGIVCAHFILVGLMLWIARSVVVTNESSLCMARLLEGLVARLGGKGSLLDDKDIVTAIQGRGARKLRVIYGIGRIGEREEERVLRLGDKEEVEKVVPKWGPFPRGTYF